MSARQADGDRSIDLRTQQLWHRAPRALWVLLALYAALALAYNYAFPPFEPTDELNHFRYVRYLIEHRRLPRFPTEDQFEYHQPPLYYALSAALSWPFPASDLPDYFSRINPYRGFLYSEPSVDNKNLYVHGPWDRWPFRKTSLSLHVARLASLLAGIATVLATYQMARALAGERVALAASGVLSFSPMFLAVTGSLQNDAGAAAGGAVTLWLSVHFYRTGFTPRRALGLGLAVGLAALMKFTAALLLVPCLLLVLVWGRENQESVGGTAALIGMLALGAAAGGGWWSLRNQIIYGDWTGVTPHLDTYGRQSVVAGVALWGQSLPYAWTTFWGRFGYGDLVLPAWTYQTLAAISLLALAGLALAWRKLDRTTRALALFLGVAAVVELAGFVSYLTISPVGANARYTFPALSAYMALLALGLLGLVPEAVRRWAAYAISGLMLVFAILTLTLYILPAYGSPRPILDLPVGVQPVDSILGDLAVLKGYQVDADQVSPGDRVHLTLYWEPLRRTELPYSVYVHLFDGEETLVTQRDTYPGLGRNSTQGWTIGETFADSYLVVIPETAYAPTAARWEVGLWQADTGERAYVLDATGQPVAAGVSFGELAIRSRPGPLPNAVDLNFGGRLRLKGYSMPARTLTPGRPFDLTMYWQPTAESSQPHLFLVQVVAADGSLWANDSFEVIGGQQTVQPVLAPDTPPGIYSLLLGVFEDAGIEQKRLKLLAEDGHEVADYVRLTGVRVAP